MARNVLTQFFTRNNTIRARIKEHSVQPSVNAHSFVTMTRGSYRRDSRWRMNHALPTQRYSARLGQNSTSAGPTHSATTQAQGRVAPRPRRDLAGGCNRKRSTPSFLPEIKAPSSCLRHRLGEPPPARRGTSITNMIYLSNTDIPTFVRKKTRLALSGDQT